MHCPLLGQIDWVFAQLAVQDDMKRKVGISVIVILLTCFEQFREGSVARDHASPSGMPPGMSCGHCQYVKYDHHGYYFITMQMLLPLSRILGSLDVAPV